MIKSESNVIVHIVTQLILNWKKLTITSSILSIYP